MRSLSAIPTITALPTLKFSYLLRASRFVMLRLLSSSRYVAAGLLVTIAQILFAVSFADPEGSWLDRYSTLVQHDSYWFANIIDRGYGTTLPPIDHKEMEVSNVAFFPAYPLIAHGLARLTSLDTYTALLVTAQMATWAFWTYFFLFCARWGLSLPLQVFGALAVAAHPAAFYLVAGYSESLFLAALVGFIYWSTREGKVARVLAVLHGFTMSATRIVGLICAGFPVVHAVFSKGWRGAANLRLCLARYRAPVLLTFLSMLGGISFFIYCQLRWGRWDLYMLTQNAGWAIVPDYLAAFRLGSYHWALPEFYAPSIVSQFTTALAGGFFLLIAVAELLSAIRWRSDWTQRIGFYFCAAIIFYLSLAGVASVQMESMLRYDLCVHAVVVLGLLHFLRPFRVTSVLARALAMGVAAIVCAAGLALQGFYVWNFTQGNWVA
jgi:hypothetical protein